MFEWEDAGALNDSDEARGSGGGGGLFEWGDDENDNTTDPLVLAERGCAGGGGRSTAFEWDDDATSDCGGGGRGGGAADAEFEQNFGAQCAAESTTVAASSELLSQAFVFGDGFSKRDAASSTQGLARGARLIWLPSPGCICRGIRRHLQVENHKPEIPAGGGRSGGAERRVRPAPRRS